MHSEDCPNWREEDPDLYDQLGVTHEMHIEGGLLNCQSVFKNDIYMTSTRLDENNNERNLPNGTDKGSGKKDTKRSILKRSFKPAAKLDKKISKPPTSQVIQICYFRMVDLQFD